MGWTTRRCPGRSWRPGCQAGSGRSRLRATVGTARPGPTTASPTSRLPMLRAATARRPLRRAALPLQLQLPRRRLPPGGAGRGGGPARAHRPGPHRPRRHVRGGPLSPRRRRPSVCPPSSGPSSRFGLSRPQNGVRRPRRRPSGRPGPGRHRLRPAVPGHLHRPDGRPGEGQAADRPGDAGRHRGRGAARHLRPADPPDNDHHPRPLADPHRLPQGTVPQPCSSTGRPGRRRAAPGSSACSAATTWPSSCGTTATRSTRPATTPSPSSPSGPAPTWSPPTTSTTTSPAGAGWPPPWPRSGPAAASTRSTAGCRRRPPPTCAAGPSRPGASPATPAWSNGPRPWQTSAPSTSAWSPPACRRFPAPPGHTEMTWLRQLTERGRPPPLRPATSPEPPAGRTPRSTTSST